MKHDVVRHIRSCRTCSEVKVERRYPAGLMGTRPNITKPWQLISCDLFGPLPRSTNGNEHVLVVVDYFSKFPLFIPMKQVTARKVIAEIEEKVFLTFGVPEFCIVDNGVQFGRSREFQEFLDNYGVTPHYNALYTPQNNPAERVNETMKGLIMSYITDDQRQWDRELGKVACAVRTAKHEATRKTPYFINFGREMVTDGREYERERERANISDSESDEDEPEENRRNGLARIRHMVGEKLRRARERARRYYNRKRREVRYEVGDLVWKREFPTTDSTKHFAAKLAKRYRGPFQVTERCGENVYALSDATGRPFGRWHVKDLKCYHPSESENNTSSDGE